MFKVDSIYHSIAPNDGDPFQIICSRNELAHLRDALELAVAHEPNKKAQDMLDKIQKAFDE